MTSHPHLHDPTAYVALGSNIDDREHYLKQAIAALKEAEGIRVECCSSMYETEPVGYVDQAPFLNMVIALTTSLPAPDLLQTLLAIENRLGRTRDVRWGPRTLDLDLLMYGDDHIASPDLTVPHPRMYERAFVLVPLVEVLGKQKSTAFEPISNRLKDLEGKEGVHLWKKVQ
jgi:2-amino-4-hydroxy-6-hydroxymethyldihydropteridine diphosphokinase